MEPYYIRISKDDFIEYFIETTRNFERGLENIMLKRKIKISYLFNFPIYK